MVSRASLWPRSALLVGVAAAIKEHAQFKVLVLVALGGVDADIIAGSLVCEVFGILSLPGVVGLLEVLVLQVAIVEVVVVGPEPDILALACRSGPVVSVAAGLIGDLVLVDGGGWFGLRESLLLICASGNFDAAHNSNRLIIPEITYIHPIGY